MEILIKFFEITNLSDLVNLVLLIEAIFRSFRWLRRRWKKRTGNYKSSIKVAYRSENLIKANKQFKKMNEEK